MRWVSRQAMFCMVTLLAAALPPSALAERAVLRVRLAGPVLEAPLPDAPFLVLLGEEQPQTLRELVNKLEKAAEDREISGAALIIDDPQMNLAQVEELTRALKSFRAKGKKVLCYIDYAGNLIYPLAAASDHITLAENSEVGILGLHAELTFYKGLLDKIGVEADMMHCGAYKSALEPFTRTEPSKELTENINWLLDGIYDRWIQLMADGRGTSPNEMKALVDRGGLTAKEALEAKLVDAVGSFEDFRKLVHKEFGKDVKIVKKYPREEGLDFEFDPSNPFAAFGQITKLMEKLFGGGEEADRPGIGLIYVEGPILVGKSEAGMFSGTTAGSTTVRAAFQKAAEDGNIKAVVVRVSSPGGSALASDIMWKAARSVALEKPLIVSMGGVAGSGGYYVSIPGDVVFAEESTITGSIGVVGGKLVWKGLMEDKLGITTTEFQRGKFADLFSMNRKWTEAERAHVFKWMNAVYEQFKGRVMESRGDRIKGNLEDLAGGRVYTGRQALERGLVDRIGGLSDALKLAAEKAGLKDYKVYVLPKEKGIEDVFKALFGEETEDEYEVSLPRMASRDPLLRLLAPLLEQLAPQQLRQMAGGLYNLVILNQEHVGCWMPFGALVR